MANYRNEIRALRNEIAQLRAEIAELRARPPVVYQPIWVQPTTAPMPTWDPLRPYCAPIRQSPDPFNTGAQPPHWPVTICGPVFISSGKDGTAVVSNVPH